MRLPPLEPHDQLSRCGATHAPVGQPEMCADAESGLGADPAGEKDDAVGAGHAPDDAATACALPAAGGDGQPELNDDRLSVCLDPIGENTEGPGVGHAPAD